MQIYNNMKNLEYKYYDPLLLDIRMVVVTVIRVTIKLVYLN